MIFEDDTGETSGTAEEDSEVVETVTEAVDGSEGEPSDGSLTEIVEEGEPSDGSLTEIVEEGEPSDGSESEGGEEPDEVDAGEEESGGSVAVLATIMAIAALLLFSEQDEQEHPQGPAF